MPKAKSYHIYEIYDRDAADPEWYWVKWLNFKAERHDTAQHRLNLERDGFGEWCDYVDEFKVWEADAEDGEIRTFKLYKKKHPVSSLLLFNFFIHFSDYLSVNSYLSVYWLMIRMSNVML